MPQTRTTAKNTFSEGLIMDFAPDNTQANVLSNALNATLLTFNGNEMSLQNDMGNCRVESAYLPEGYVPVGTCEFGDIIYIVSYNPLENKSQIGCFPSPERNISNKEVSALVQQISPSEFTDSSTGTVNASTVKKIVYGNNNINAGDKFIISWGESGLRNKDQISNFGNTSHNIKATEAYWPKLTQLHVVSIEDSGKITYLDDSVKWYGSTGNDFVISTEDLTNDTTTSNIDTYRHALQCQYSVFQSRVAGKLALLLELETIDNFSCGHKVIKRIDANTKTDLYDVYFSASWESDNYNINPSGMIVTSSTFNHMLPIKDNNYTKLYTEDSKNSLYNPKRVIDFTRLYKMESPGNDYESFLSNNSYYTKVKDYLTITGDNSKTAESKTVLRVYNLQDGVKSPKVDSSTGSGIYVINPSSLEYDSENSNIIYKTVIDNKIQVCPETVIPDDVVVNSFKKSVLKKIATVQRRTYTSTEAEQQALSDEQNDYKITYTVCPCMPYGPLSHLSITNTIDFDKAQTGEVSLSIWKYYVNTSSITLTFGFDTYLKEDENEVIDKVVMEFYDNQGICATYELTGQESYESKFTEYIELDQASSNFRMTGMKIPDGSTSRELTEHIFHKGSDASANYADIKDTDNKYSYMYEKDGKWYAVTDDSAPGDSTKVYINDAGTLYYGRPYIVKIKVYKGTLNDLGEIDPSGYDTPLEEARWLWTAPVFNDYYSNETDFKNCNIQVSLDFTSQLDGRGLSTSSVVYDYPEEITTATDTYKTLGAQVTYLGIGNNINNTIAFRGQPELSDNFGKSLYLDAGTDCANYNKIQIGLALDNVRIESSTSSYETEYTDSYLGEVAALYPQINTDTTKSFDETILSYGKNLLEKLGYEADSVVNKELYDSETSYQSYYDLFDLTLNVSEQIGTETDTVNYLDSNGNTITSTLNFTNLTAKKWFEGTKRGDNYFYTKLQLKGITFSKMKAENIVPKATSALLVPAIDTTSDLTKYGYSWSDSENLPYQTNVPYLGGGGVHGGRNKSSCFLQYSKSTSEVTSNYYERRIAQANETIYYFDDQSIESDFYENFLHYPFQQFVLGWCHTGDNQMDHGEIPGIDCSPLVKVMGHESGSMNDKYRFSNASFPVPFADYAYFETARDGNTSRNLPTTLVLYDGDQMWFTGDLRLLDARNGYTLSQNFAWKSSASSDIKNYRVNFAQLIVSMLTQLYVVNDAESEVPSYTGVAKLKDFTENWKTNIVVKSTLTSADAYSFEASKATSAYIKILPKDFTYDSKTYNGINLYYYAKQVIINAGYTEDKAIEALGINNINPIINDSVKCVDFTYQVPYNVSTLATKFEDSDNLTAKIKVKTPSDKQYNNTTKFTGKVEYKSIVAPKDTSVLYTYSGGTQVHQFKSGESLNLRTFAVVGDEFYSTDILKSDGSAYPLELNSISNLYKCLKYDGGQVYLENISSMTRSSQKFQIHLPANGGNSDRDTYFKALRKMCLFDTSYNIF